MTRLPLLHDVAKYSGVYGDEVYNNVHLQLTKIGAIIIFYFGFGMLYHLAITVPDSNISLAEKCNSLLACCTYLMMFSNYIMLYIKRHEHKIIITEIETFDNFGEPQNVIKKLKIIELISFFLTVLGGAAAWVSTILEMIQYENCMENRPNPNCGYIILISYPYFKLEGFLYYLHLVFEIYVAYKSCFCGSHLMASSIAAIELIILRLNHLKELLKNVTKDPYDEVQYKKLRKCIMYHIYIIDLAERANNCYKIGITIILLGYAINMGCTMIAFLEEYSLLACCNVIGWNFTVILLCRSGQRLHDTSLSIADAIYDLDWIKSSKKFKMDVQFVILRANKPLTYKCLWGLDDFLFATYKKVMSAAYTFTSLRKGFGQ